MQATKVYLLVDWRPGGTNFPLAVELKRLGFDVVLLGIPGYDMKNRLVRWRKIVLWMQYLRLGIASLRQSRKGEVILSWNFVVGALAGFFNRMLGLRRRILALNMIVYRKGQLISIIRTIVYNYVFNSDEFFMTVNAAELVELYKADYGMRIRHFAQLSDVYTGSHQEMPYHEGEGYIFSGGEAARDWATLLEAARMTPELRFKVVARGINFPAGAEIPGNVEVRFDTTDAVFYDLVNKSSLVVLPLATMVPAGLIVLIRTALLCRPVIATSTPSTRPYIIHGKTGVLVERGDVRSLSEQMRKLMQSPAEREKYALELKRHVTQNFTPQKHAARIADILRGNKWIE